MPFWRYLPVQLGRRCSNGAIQVDGLIFVNNSLNVTAPGGAVLIRSYDLNAIAERLFSWRLPTS